MSLHLPVLFGNQGTNFGKKNFIVIVINIPFFSKVMINLFFIHLLPYAVFAIVFLKIT